MSYQPPSPGTTRENSEINPYASPTSNTTGISPVEGNAINPIIIDTLRKTKGWTRFISILLFILGGLYILGGIGNLFVSFLSGIFIFVFALLVIYPGVKLAQYSSKISKLIATPNEENLIIALEQQRAFWKYAGIAGIFLILMLILFAVIAGTLVSSFS